MLNKKSVDDINVKGKKVLVRCDFNVPLQDGKITDENRLVAALPTIKKLIADGGKVILCSHLGKPKGEPKPELSLAPVAVRLSELLGQEVKFAADATVVGENAKAAVAAMNDGDVVLLENTRYRAEETKNGEEFSKELASLCDVFVNDAFGTAHRAHCSNVGVTKFVDTAVVGYLMQKEIDFLGNAVNNPERPFVAILGGSKVSSKISVINNLLDKVDTLIIGGGMAFTFLSAKGYAIGDSLFEADYVDYAKEMMAKAEANGKKLLIPVDTMAAELKKRGILVTAVCPGPVRTEFFDRAGALAASEKEALCAEPEAVVTQALTDSVRGRRVSVYGAAMKGSRILSKILPDRLLVWGMMKINHADI